MTDRRMPAVFIGHGNPMNALAHNAYTEAWGVLAEALPRPKAILAVSAHRDDDAVAWKVGGFDGGSISMLALQLG